MVTPKKTSVNNFVENEFLSRDSMAFRNIYVNEITPDVDMTSTYFDEDGEEKEFTSHDRFVSLA